MALRVLLADESSTIKKVFQLSLQDYAVDVATVTVGLDVANVARHFKPDIIFCDILLQKKNGYEVCSELKSDSELHSVPVVLMWSNFMELDEDKLEAARADSRLEKPFDVQDLRRIVNQLVPNTQGNRLSAYLTFPKMPEMIEKPSAPAKAPAQGGLETHQEWSMESFDPIPSTDGPEAFEEVALPPQPKSELEGLESDDEDNAWSAETLGSIKVPADELNNDELVLKVPDDDVLELDEEVEPELPTLVTNPPPVMPKAAATAPKASAGAPKAAASSPKSSPAPAKTPTSSPDLGNLTEEQLEAIIRKQSQAVIESVVWKVVPDLAQQIIERELKRLLDETR